MRLASALSHVTSASPHAARAAHSWLTARASRNAHSVRTCMQHEGGRARRGFGAPRSSAVLRPTRGAPIFASGAASTTSTATSTTSRGARARPSNPPPGRFSPRRVRPAHRCRSIRCATGSSAAADAAAAAARLAAAAVRVARAVRPPSVRPVRRSVGCDDVCGRCEGARARVRARARAQGCGADEGGRGVALVPRVGAARGAVGHVHTLYRSCGDLVFTPSQSCE